MFEHNVKSYIYDYYIICFDKKRSKNYVCKFRYLIIVFIIIVRVRS